VFTPLVTVMINETDLCAIIMSAKHTHASDHHFQL
jgi:hypothetical protein